MPKNLEKTIIVDKNWRKNYINCASVGEVAQSVERGTENPCVGGSIPSLAIFFIL
jgi:hypothetical protein